MAIVVRDHVREVDHWERYEVEPDADVDYFEEQVDSSRYFVATRPFTPLYKYVVRYVIVNKLITLWQFVGLLKSI